MQGAPFYESHCRVDPVAPFFEILKIWPFYGSNLVLTWPA